MKYLPNFFRKGQLTKLFFLFPVSVCCGFAVLYNAAALLRVLLECAAALLLVTLPSLVSAVTPDSI